MGSRTASAGEHWLNRGAKDLLLLSPPFELTQLTQISQMCCSFTTLPFTQTKDSHTNREKAMVASLIP